MGYFKGEDIEAIEMEMENPFSVSTFKEFYLLSEEQARQTELEEWQKASDDKFRLLLFERSKSA